MTEWRWVAPGVAHAIHDRQIAEHGGGDGVRDAGAIEAALAGPQHLAAYGNPNAAALAAAYCYGIVKGHGYVDGNKRTGWIIARLFLMDNGATLTFDPADAVNMVEGLAGSTIGEEDFAQWLSQRIS